MWPIVVTHKIHVSGVLFRQLRKFSTRLKLQHTREGQYHGPDISSALHPLSGKCLVSQKQRLHLQAGLEKQMTDIHILLMHDSTIEI